MKFELVQLVWAFNVLLLGYVAGSRYVFTWSEKVIWLIFLSLSVGALCFN